MKIKKTTQLLTIPLLIIPRVATTLLLALVVASVVTLATASESLAQQRNVWASGGSKGVWAVIRNGISEAGFKSNLRVRYQTGVGAEASLRLLDKIDDSSPNAVKQSAQVPSGMLLAAEPYYLRALIEQKAQTSNIPMILLGADTGSKSQPKNVLAIVGIDAFATGKRAAQYAMGQAKLRNLLAAESPSLCLRTRSDDPARARICRGIAAGLQKPVAMLNIAPKVKGAKGAKGAKGKQHNTRAGSDKPLNIKLLQNYLKKNPRTPLLWLDDGAFTQELLEESELALQESSQESLPAPLVVFGLDVSQKNIIEKNPQRIAFVIDLKPFQQGQLAMKILRDYLRVANRQVAANSGEKTQIHSLTPRMLDSEAIGKILPAIGRTR